MFVDSHAHLDGERYDPDREQVIARARENKIETILAIGIGDGPGSLDCAIQLAAQHDFIELAQQRIQLGALLRCQALLPS